MNLRSVFSFSLPLSIFTSLAAMVPSFAHATNVLDLKLNCSGTYQVLSTKAYYVPSPTGPRRYTPPPEAGDVEQIQITSLTGDGCAKLAFYGLNLAVGQTLKYQNATGESQADGVQAAAARLGKSFAFQVQQSFTYVGEQGELPLFPLVHDEYVYVLGLTGHADAQALYGVPLPSQLTDAQKQSIDKWIWSSLNWGTNSNASTAWVDAWWTLALTLVPNDPSAKGSYTSDLELVFQNLTKEHDNLVSYDVATAVAHQLNHLLNTNGGTPWQTKLQVLEKNPLLFDQQVVVFAPDVSQAPQLTAAELEAFLNDALATVQKLAPVEDQVYEAVMLKVQYQNAAKTIESQKATGNSWGPKYDVSAAAEALIQQILAVK